MTKNNSLTSLWVFQEVSFKCLSFKFYYFAQFQGLFNADKGQKGFLRKQGVSPTIMVDDIAQRRRSQPP